MAYIPDMYPAAYDTGKAITHCHILDIRVLAREGKAALLTGEIAPRYACKAWERRSEEGALAEIGVGILLARALNITTDEALSIDEYGKPFLTAGDHEIGIAHAGHLVVLAVSNCAVGVDVEPLPDVVDRRHRFALERAYGSRLEETMGSDGALTPRRFCELWTRVEAAVKLDGRGLRIDCRENPQIFDGVCFYTLEHEKHIITVAACRSGAVEIQLV